MKIVLFSDGTIRKEASSNFELRVDGIPKEFNSEEELLKACKEKHAERERIFLNTEGKFVEYPTYHHRIKERFNLEAEYGKIPAAIYNYLLNTNIEVSEKFIKYVE